MVTSRDIFCSTASLVVFMLFLRPGSSDIIVAPNNSEAKIGGSAYFNCSTSITSKEIHWFHYPIGSQDRRFVYSFNQFYPSYLGSFSLEKNDTSGEYNLVITSVKAEDAGKYECQDDVGSGMKKSAQLIILDTELVCQSNINVDEVTGPNACGIKPDQLILSCMVQYRGNEAPILQWGLNDNNTPITSGVTHKNNTNSVAYNLTMTTDQISNGSFYVCQTTRSTTKISCKSGEIRVVGSNKTQEACDGNGDDDCKSDNTAIICICIFLVGPLVIAVVLLTLKLTKPELKDEENQQPTTEEPTKAEASETNQKPEEAADIKKPLIRNESGESNEGLISQIKQLQNDVHALQQSLDQQNLTMQEHQQNEESNNNKIISLQSEKEQLQSEKERLQSEKEQLQSEKEQLRLENKQLQAKVKYFEQHLYPKEKIDYTDKPVLAHELHVRLPEKNNGKSINGITTLVNELFVVTESSQEIQVYDSKTFKLVESREVRGLAEPLDITSSKTGNCLYIIDRVSTETNSKIMRIDPMGNVSDQWSTGGGNGRLSTCEANVIVSLSDKQLINEYSPNGELILTVRLSSAAKLNHPWHAIKVTSAHFVVSHGDVNDNLHRVCLVDLDGNIKKECTKWEKSKFLERTEMNVPICLAEDNERSIIVADRDNNRILLLSSLLKYQKKVIDKEHGLKDLYPVRLCFDDSQSQLFVAANKYNTSKKKWEDGRVLIFNIK